MLTAALLRMKLHYLKLLNYDMDSIPVTHYHDDTHVSEVSSDPRARAALE